MPQKIDFLIIRCIKGEQSIESAKKQLKTISKIDLKNALITYFNNITAENQAPQVLEMLLELGVNPNLEVPGADGNFPLIFKLIELAAVNGNTEALDVLLEEKLDMNIKLPRYKEIEECTPWCFALYLTKDNLKVMEKIVQKLLETSIYLGETSIYNGKKVTGSQFLEKLGIDAEDLDLSTHKLMEDNVKNKPNLTICIGIAAGVGAASLPIVLYFTKALEAIKVLTESVIWTDFITFIAMGLAGATFALLSSIIVDIAGYDDIIYLDKALINAGLIFAAHSIFMPFGAVCLSEQLLKRTIYISDYCDVTKSGSIIALTIANVVMIGLDIILAYVAEAMAEENKL